MGDSIAGFIVSSERLCSVPLYVGGNARFGPDGESGDWLLECKQESDVWRV